MKINTAWCFFEQSGTFKKAFQRQGISAFDVDIKNNFGETDFCIDLFEEIRDAARGEKTVFSEIGKDDLIFAFFPCTRFSARVPLNARGEGAQMKDWSLQEKLTYSAKTVKEIVENYEVLCLLVEVCLQRELRLVIEKPYTLPPVELCLSDKYQKRGTGKNSQNTLLHCIIRTIAVETGNDFAVVKREVKRQAIAMGYPIEKDGAGNYVMDILFNEPKPQSEADCTTVEESILIDCAIRMASELGIVLEGVN